MFLNRAWIEAHIPHQGRMCLLDEVLEWDRQRIRCRSATHRAADNPMRSRGGLGIACGIEYAAQTMALHAALALQGASAAGTAGGAALKMPGVGLLAGVRDVHFSVTRLDDIESDLFCEATLIAGDTGTAIYGFVLGDGRRNLCGGRATILLHAHKRLRT